MTAAAPTRPAPPSGLLLVFGTTLVVPGVAVILTACALHMRFRRHLAWGEPYRPAQWPLGVAVGVAFAAIGAATTAFLLLPRN